MSQQPDNGASHDEHFRRLFEQSFQCTWVLAPDGTIVEIATRGPGWTRDEPADSIGTTHRDPPPEKTAAAGDHDAHSTLPKPLFAC